MQRHLDASERALSWLEGLKSRARKLKTDTYALYLAYQDPRTPLTAKVVTFLVVAYALSPIDLIPDFVPVLGYLDDLVLVPAGIAFAIRLIPTEVLTACREQALRKFEQPTSRAGLLIVIGIWLALAILVAWLLYRLFGRA